MIWDEWGYFNWWVIASGQLIPDGDRCETDKVYSMGGTTKLYQISWLWLIWIVIVGFKDTLQVVIDSDSVNVKCDSFISEYHAYSNTKIDECGESAIVVWNQHDRANKRMCVYCM